MKTNCWCLGCSAGSSLFAGTRVSVGIGSWLRVRAPPPVMDTPAFPGPGYTWVAGLWGYSGPRRFGRRYWAPPRLSVRPGRASVNDTPRLSGERRRSPQPRTRGGTFQAAAGASGLRSGTAH